MIDHCHISFRATSEIFINILREGVDENQRRKSFQSTREDLSTVSQRFAIFSPRLKRSFSTTRAILTSYIYFFSIDYFSHCTYVGVTFYCNAIVDLYKLGIK